MTRSDSTSHSSHTSDLIRICELAILAGMSGKPLLVAFANTSALSTCQLLRTLSQTVGLPHLLNVDSLADVRRFQKGEETPRMILVRSARLLESTTWAVALNDSGVASPPTVFCTCQAEVVEQIPVPVLTLQAESCDASDAPHGRERDNTLDVSLEQLDRNSVASEAQHVVDQIMGQLRSHCATTIYRSNDDQLLQSLLYGAWRYCQAADSGSLDSAHGLLTRTYALVRELLVSPAICQAECQVNQLAVDMINRSNVLLELRADPQCSYEHAEISQDREIIRLPNGCRERDDLICRREIADLGNVNSRLNRQIVTVLQRLPDGRQAFNRMGSVGTLPSRRDFSECDTETLTRSLRPWSPKQVRTHFETMCKSGLVTGERESANGPWRYRLPEQFDANQSRFAYLPAPAELFNTDLAPTQERTM